MGVQRLQTYLRKHRIGEKKPLDNLSNKKLVVDGDSVSFYLYEVSNFPTIYGGEYYDLEKFMLNFLKKIINKNIQLIVVFDGIPPEEKWNTILERRKSKSDRHTLWWSELKEKNISSDYCGEIPVHYPSFVRTTLLSAISKLSIKVIHAIGENDDAIVALTKKNNYYGVIAKDTDFVIYDLPCYIPIHQINFFENNYIEINRSNLTSNLGIKLWQLPLLSFLAGNDITHGHIFVRNKLSKFHEDSRPDIILNLAKKIKTDLESIFNFIHSDNLILKLYYQTCKKYNLKLFSNDHNLLNDTRLKQYKECKLNTDVVVLLTRKKRYFQKLPTLSRHKFTINLKNLRNKIYSYIFPENTIIVEQFWKNLINNKNKENELMEKNIEIDNNRIKSSNIIENISNIFDLNKTLLESLPDVWKIIYISIKILILSKIYDNNQTLYLVKTILLQCSNIENYSSDKIDSIIGFSVLDYNILELSDIYVCCLQESLFTNQLLGFPINIISVEKLYRGRLFYLSYLRKIEYNFNKYSQKIGISLYNFDICNNKNDQYFLSKTKHYYKENKNHKWKHFSRDWKKTSENISLNKEDAGWTTVKRKKKKSYYKS